jgi:MFS family permease
MLQTSINELGKLKSENNIWKNKNYVILFATALLVTFGGKIYELTIPLIIFELTRSSISMGLMSAIEFLPNILLAVFIGAIIDRIENQKFFMFSTVLLQGIVLFILYVFLKSSNFSIAYLYVFAFFLMALNYGYYNVRFGIIKHTMPFSLYAKATANLMFVTELVTVLGPTIGGLILLLSNLKIGILITGTSLLLTAAISLLLTSNQTPERDATNKRQLVLEIKEAWINFKGLKALWALTWFVVVTNATYGMFNAMLIYFAKVSLALNNSMVGVLLSMLGLGGVFGSILFNFLRVKMGLGRTIGICVLLSGIGYACLYFSNDIYSTCLILFVIGLFVTTFSIGIHTHRQEITPAKYMGRIVGITGSIFKIAMPLFIFGSGWITNIFSAQIVFLFSGILNISLFIFYIFSIAWKVE